MSRKVRHHDKRDEADDPHAGRDLAGPSSDMNVTPLIDVLLVLLVIFMAALPLAQRGVDINLPLERQAETPPDPQTQVVVALSTDLELTVNSKPVALADLDATLRETFENRTDKTVFIIGPGSVRYGDMMGIIDVATGVGLRVAVVTEKNRPPAGG